MLRRLAGKGWMTSICRLVMGFHLVSASAFVFGSTRIVNGFDFQMFTGESVVKALQPISIAFESYHHATTD